MATNGAGLPSEFAIVPGESGAPPSVDLARVISETGSSKRIVLAHFLCDVSAFLKALEDAANVCAISLHTMDLVGGTFQALCELVKNNTNITTLSIANIVQFSSDCVYQLADTIEETDSLKILNIRGVYGTIDSIPYDRLCHAMSVNTSIIKFQVHQSPHFPEKISLALKFMAMHNRMVKAQIPVYPEAKMLVQNRGAWALHRLQFAGSDDPASKKVADRAGLLHKTVYMLEAEIDILKKDLVDLQQKVANGESAGAAENGGAAADNVSSAAAAASVVSTPAAAAASVAPAVDEGQAAQTPERKRRSTSTPTRRKSMRLAAPTNTVIRNGRSLRKTLSRK